MSGESAKRATIAAPVLVLRGERGEEIVDVLCASFRDYPVMRYVIGDEHADYDARLRRLVALFVSARLLQRHPIYAIEDAGRIVSVGTTTPPGSHKRPPEFQAMRDEAWRALGADAEARYETLIAAWESGSFPEPCLHVNMLGTLRSHAGRGCGRRILDAVQESSRRDPPTLGVSLSTEDPKNVPLYEHCGYRVVHHARVTDALETWLLFRDNEAGAGGDARGASA